jgi:putative transposase
LVFLPPYAPELNPIEPVWAYVKRNVLGNCCARSVSFLKAKLVTAWQRIRYIQRPRHLTDANVQREQ